MRIFKLILFILLSFLVSCSSDNDAETSSTPPEVTASPDVVDINWDETQLSEYDEESGKMTMTFSGSVPEFEEGKSLIVVGTDQVTAIRRVISVTESNDNSVTMETMQASMADLFPGQKFTLSFSDEKENGQISSRAKNGSYLPVKVEVMTDEGFRTIYDASNPSRSVSYGEDEDYKILTENVPLFEKTISYSGQKLIPEEKFSPIMDKCELNLGIYGRFSFDFGETVKDIKPGLQVKTGELKKYEVTLKGKLNFDFLLKYHFEGEYKYDKSVTLKPDLIKTLRFKFMAGSVPVYISVNARLNGYLSAIAEGYATATAGLYCGTEVECGFSWEKDRGFTPNKPKEPKNEMKLHMPTIEGKGSCDAKGSIYPELTLKFYDFVGLDCSLRPYLKNSFNASADLEMGGDDNYMSITDNLYFGIDFANKAYFEFLGEELTKILDDTTSVYEKELFASPARVRIINKDVKTETGKPVTIELEVLDKNILSPDGFSPSNLGVVNLRCLPDYGGKVDKPFVLPKNGRASVTWTPGKNNDMFLAELFDKDKNIISNDKIRHLGKGLIGYWIMKKYYYAEYDAEGNLKREEWDTTNSMQDFFDFEFLEGGIYYDIDPISGDRGKGTYIYDEQKNILILDDMELFKILRQDEKELIIETDKIPLDGGTYLERIYFIRRD